MAQHCNVRRRRKYVHSAFLKLGAFLERRRNPTNSNCLPRDDVILSVIWGYTYPHIEDERVKK